MMEVEAPMGKGRLQPEFLERTEAFSDRCLAVAERLHTDGRFSRIVEQLASSGCSVGANTAEADQAVSVRDFRRSLGIVAKELSETRFWLRLAIRRGWLAAGTLDPLLAELEEIRRVVGSILSRTASMVRSRETSPIHGASGPDLTI